LNKKNIAQSNPYLEKLIMLKDQFSSLSHSGTPAISCSYKAATGLLYPLERGFIFVHKPPVHIRFDEVAAVNFARSAGSTRSFDFDVETKAGNVYTFSNIEKYVP